MRRLPIAELVRDSAPTDGQPILHFHAHADRTHLAARDPRRAVDISGSLDDQVVLIREPPIVVEVAHVIVAGEPFSWTTRCYSRPTVGSGVKPSRGQRTRRIALG